MEFLSCIFLFVYRLLDRFVCIKFLIFLLIFYAVLCFTVGYGNISPSSTTGRMFMIFYALIGIPVNGFLFAYLGDFFGKVVSRTIELHQLHYFIFLLSIFFIFHFNSLLALMNDTRRTKWQQIKITCLISWV